MRIIVYTCDISPLSIPSFEIVPFLITGSRDVVRTGSATYSSTAKSNAAPGASCLGRTVVVVGLFDVASAVAGETMET